MIIYQRAVYLNLRYTTKMSQILVRKDKHDLQNSSKVRAMFDIICEYSEYSTIQGVIYIFQSNQTQIGKLFWILVIVSMMVLGVYWSVGAYQVDFLFFLCWLPRAWASVIKIMYVNYKLFTKQNIYSFVDLKKIVSCFPVVCKLHA